MCAFGHSGLAPFVFFGRWRHRQDFASVIFGDSFTSRLQRRAMRGSCCVNTLATLTEEPPCHCFMLAVLCSCFFGGGDKAFRDTAFLITAKTRRKVTSLLSWMQQGQLSSWSAAAPCCICVFVRLCQLAAFDPVRSQRDRPCCHCLNLHLAEF